MQARSRWFWRAVAIYPIWVVLTVLGTSLTLDQPRSLTDAVSRSVALGPLLASILLAAVAIRYRWPDLGFSAPRPWRSLTVLWLPLLYVAAFGAAAVSLGLPAPARMAVVAFNLAVVGLSEELMFRGILFQGLRSRFRLKPAIWLATALFGVVHLLNASITGDLPTAAAQSVAAFFSGMMFMAVRVRTRSIYPGIVLHFLWNTSTFLMLMSAGVEAAGGEAVPTEPLQVFLPVLIVLPNFLYALYLLRGIRDDPDPGVAAG